MIIDFRRIRIGDVKAISDLALAAIPCDPELRVSPAKIIQMVTYFAIHHEHFQLAAFDGETPVAGIAMYVTEMPFHERCEGCVMFCYSKLPGAGYRLVREMIRWVLNDMRIRRVSWSMNRGYDPRIKRLAARCGFAETNDVLMYYKG
jgi:hypothetical protein